MLDFTIKVNWLEKFIKKIDSRRWVEEWINKWIKKTIFFLQWEVIPFTPVQTWVLRNSYSQRFKNLYWNLFNTRKYWVYVHEWTRFIKANPFMTKALKKSEWKVSLIMNNEIRKSLSILK